MRIRTTVKNDQKPGISIIIAARNEFHNLQQLIPVILDQDYPQFEIVIINDRSEDGSKDYLDHLEKDPKIKAIHVDHLPDHVNSKKYALTLGIKAATYDTLLFTDADCIPASNQWINGMVSGYTNNRIQIVIGFSPYKIEGGLLNAVIRFETLYTGMQYLAAAANGNVYMGVGRNLSYKRELFLAKKGFNGFHQITGGDDDLFVNKNANSGNTSVSLNPDCTTVSVPKKSWKEYAHQKIRHLSVGKYYKNRDKIFLGLFSMSHIFSWILMITAIIANLYPLPVFLIFFAGYMLFFLNIRLMNQKSGSGISLLLIPFLDVIYMFFYIFVGIRSVFTKKVGWTT